VDIEIPVVCTFLKDYPDLRDFFERQNPDMPEKG